MVVNLDVRNPQSGWLGVPVAALGLGDEEQYVVHDLLNGQRYLWRGSWNYVHLDPTGEGAIAAHVIVFEGRAQDERRVEAYA